MNQHIPPHDVKAGQLRQWQFTSPDNPSYNGECFLVTEVDGVRVEIVGNPGGKSSFYVVWLAERSCVVSKEG
jgi:hypothetical protein